MGIFDIVILICALCGLIMVVGSLYLLYKGSITMDESKGTTSFELQAFKFSTHTPVLTLFIIGLVFLYIPITKSSQSEYTITGQVACTNDNDTITVKIENDKLYEGPTASDGIINAHISPNPGRMLLTCTAPGFPPFTQWIDTKSGSMGKISLSAIEHFCKQKKVTPSTFANGKMNVNADSIVKPKVDLPPINAKPSF